MNHFAVYSNEMLIKIVGNLIFIIAYVSVMTSTKNLPYTLAGPFCHCYVLDLIPSLLLFPSFFPCN